eukprot:COSAG02_NODE_3863_length_6129_cov_2.692869_5_plen_53_part_01
MHGDLASYFSIHTDQASSFGGCMAQASYFDTARRLASFLKMIEPRNRRDFSNT